MALPEDRLREAEERMEAGRIRALIIEDNQDITANLYAFLEPLGYELDCSANGHIGLEMAVAGTFDVIVLDIMLPEEDGLQILRKIRAGGPWKGIPVMMLTAKGTEYDKVIGLDAGADDYVPKPFGMMELLARVRALLRRSGGKQSQAEYAVGPLYVCPARHVVRVNGQDVTLTLKEYEVLKMLLENQDVVLTLSLIHI